MKAWTRSVVFVVLTAAFLGLAGSILAQGGPWYFALSYVGCGAVTGMLAMKARPGAGSLSRRADTADAAARRARRSGNPALRASADERDDLPG